MIEVYDNSHIQGSNSVGAFITFGSEGFIKKQYRKFNIKNKELNSGDDYGMLKEVFERRFSKIIKNKKQTDVIIPRSSNYRWWKRTIFSRQKNIRRLRFSRYSNNSYCQG